MNLNETGFLAIDRGDFQEAVNIFRKSYGQADNAAAYYGFGLAHFRLEDYPTARWAFHKALELEPEHPEAARYVAEIGAPGFGSKEKKLPPRKKRRFRIGKGCFEVWQGGKWKKLFVKGINLGLGLPGYFPGEHAIRKKTYFKWFEQMSGIGINAVRIYAVHPPSFYEALDEWNRSSGKALYLFQGIWMELPEDGDYSSDDFLSYARANVREAVDIVHGNAVLPPRPGYPDGEYTADISWCTLGVMYGREWESCSVKHYNELQGRKRGQYDGRFLAVADAEPFEVWITEMCDFIQQYENERYGITTPCSTINWPSLDPLFHPSEPSTEEESAFLGIDVEPGVCNENEDMESLDVAKIRSVSGAGFFVVYHAYPYYPDFMNNDYELEEEPYLAYLKALKVHHGDQPIVIAEFGVPSSQANAHAHRDGWNHGGHTHEQQGEFNALQMKAIHRAGMAGGMLFSWFDEWFKKNWVFYSYYLPSNRKPLWFNMQDPEENYGLLDAYPGYPGKKVTLTGSLDEWKGARVLYEDRSGNPMFRFGDGGDDARTLVRLLAQHDEGFFYLLLETKGAIDFEKAAYAIGISTCGPDIGEFLFPFDTKVESPVGMHFLVHLAGERNSRIMAARSYDRFLNLSRGQIYPVWSDEGAWVSIMNRANPRRISKDKSRFYPAQTQFLGRMRQGSLDSNRSDFNSLADFSVSGNLVELRIHWSQLNFSDPSSHSVLWMQGEEKWRNTEGISAVAVSYRPRKGSPAASQTGKEVNATDILPRKLDAEAVTLYTWDPWDVPIYHMHPKKSFYAYKKVLLEIPEEILR